MCFFGTEELQDQADRYLCQQTYIKITYICDSKAGGEHLCVCAEYRIQIGYIIVSEILRDKHRNMDKVLIPKIKSENKNQQSLEDKYKLLLIAK